MDCLTPSQTPNTFAEAKSAVLSIPIDQWDTEFTMSGEDRLSTFLLIAGNNLDGEKPTFSPTHDVFSGKVIDVELDWRPYKGKGDPITFKGPEVMELYLQIRNQILEYEEEQGFVPPRFDEDE